MTSLRFLGELPLWAGLLLAVTTSAMAWRFYNRESFGLPRRMKWLLPLLRSTALFLGIMILTGPVLHHRIIIGELGHVTLIVDQSGSMSLSDRQMPAGRKLLIAEQLGWLPPGKVNAALLHQADGVADVLQQLLLATSSRPPSPLSSTDSAADSAEPADSAVPSPHGAGTQGPDELPATEFPDVAQSLKRFGNRVDALQKQFPDAVRSFYRDNCVPALNAAVQAAADPQDSAKLQELVRVTRSLEDLLRQDFEQSVTEAMESGDESIRSALTAFDQTPRWRRTQLALNRPDHSLLTRLREQHEVQVVDLDGRPLSQYQPAAQERAAAGDEHTPDFTPITDLGSRLSAPHADFRPTEATNESTPADAGSSPRGAVVLLTDGQHNSGPSPLQAARLQGSQGRQYIGISVGTSEPALDLAVLNIETAQTVFRKDQLRGTLVIRDRVAAGRSFVIQIHADNEVLWQKQLISEDLSERRIEFEFPVEDLLQHTQLPGSSDVRWHALPVTLEAAIVPLSDETETANNQMPLRVTVIVQTYKVLLLDGRSRWETRYLRNVFERDEQWDITTVIAGPDTDQPSLPRGSSADQFPATRDQLFSYDVVLFGEVAAELFRPEEFQWLREFVEFRGGGIVFIDGHRGQLRKLQADNLASLLPVAWLETNAPEAAAGLQLTPAGAAQTALSLQPDAQQNQSFWKTLPPPHAVIPVRALPGAEVLAEVLLNDSSGETLPGIVTRSYGAGRVLYLAFDETWRWRYKVADLWHQRIWNQLARFVMARPFAVSDDYLSLDTGPASYQPGQPVDVRILLRDPSGRPAVDVTAEAVFWKDGQVVSTLALTADPDVPGSYAGRAESPGEGTYEVSVQAAGFSRAALKARTQFVVQIPPSGEMLQTAVNESLLQDMATVSGGLYLREEQISRLPEILSPLSSGRVVESDTLLWQSYWWFIAIILLMTAEWILRKRVGLL